MTRQHAIGALLLLAGCAGPVAPVLPASLTLPAVVLDAAAAGEPPPAGTVAGTVYRLEGAAFVPAPGATVEAAGARATTDAQGRYGFERLPGEVDLRPALSGHAGPALRARLPAPGGVARVNLVLVPTALAADGGRAIAGVVGDPRGAAVPGAEVRVVDAASGGGAGGNRAVTADANGCFVAPLAGVHATALTPSAASLTATGLTPGGVRVETTAVAEAAVDDRRAIAVALRADALRHPTGLTAIAPNAVRASGLPTRRDELVIRLTGPWGVHDVVPDAIAGDVARFAAPAGCCAGQGGLALRVLGIAAEDPGSMLRWPPDPRQASAPGVSGRGLPGIYSVCIGTSP